MPRQNHPSLKEFIESGLLDSAIFDAVNDKVIRLAHSKKVSQWVVDLGGRRCAPLRPHLDGPSRQALDASYACDVLTCWLCAWQVLGPGSVKNPVCIVANYLFDTLCHDIFQVSQSIAQHCYG
jgi:hypothetical protein